jgi:hypothetical protein
MVSRGEDYRAGVALPNKVHDLAHDPAIKWMVPLKSKKRVESSGH